MNYCDWMSCIKDEVRLCDTVIPSAHNAGTRGMNKMACCQDADVYGQYLFGIRHFCIRLDTAKNGEIVLCHGISKGEPFENALKSFRRMLLEAPTEFFIFDIREYYEQKFGPVTLRYKADRDKTNALIEKYLEPEKYALHGFEDIGKLSMGDIRRSGKRYLLINYKTEYSCSLNCRQYFPWDRSIYGMKAESFAKECTQMFDDSHYEGGGLFWFQTQQTPNIGTQIGLSSPRRLDRLLRPYFHIITDTIAENPDYLKKANIIAGDFMTENYEKVNRILKLNVLKGNVKPEAEKDFQKAFSL